MGRTIPTNVEIGEFLRRFRKTRLKIPSLGEFEDLLKPMVTSDRGPRQTLSRSGLQRREAGRTDCELSTFLLMLAQAGVRMRLVDELGRLLPPDLQIHDVPDGPPRGIDFLEMATDLARTVDDLMTMADYADNTGRALETEQEKEPFTSEVADGELRQ